MNPFAAGAAARYAGENARALRWMLDRPRRHGAFLDTKFDPVRRADRAAGDPWAGPATTYGWIQGRGLEALLRHAAFYRTTRPDLARDLLAAARPLAARLEALLAAHHGRAAFAYDAALRPVRRGPGDAALPQALSPAIATYADIFVRKGLIAAAHAFEPHRLDAAIAAFDRLVEDVEAGRFQMDEAAPITGRAPPEDADHYGPRMILLGAAGLLAHVGRPAAARALAERLVPPVLARHLAPSGLLADRGGGAAANPGHAIEFVGFAFEALGRATPPDLAATLLRVLEASIAAGFDGPGIRLSVPVAGGAPLDRRMPWWSLPEAIRAAALAHAATGSATALGIWRRADAAFFAEYWLGDPPVALQMRGDDGPLDVAPATPDLDPGYHTGLSLLAAAEAAGG